MEKIAAKVSANTRVGAFSSFVGKQFTVALLVGLVVGTLIGIAEGTAALVSQGLIGRYNELLAWAIVIDAAAMIAVEIVLAIFNGLVFLLARRSPPVHSLLPLQLAETVYLLVFVRGLSTRGFADPRLLASNPLLVLVPPALAGFALALVVFVILFRSIPRISVLRRLRVRYWLAAEVIVVAAAIVFSVSR